MDTKNIVQIITDSTLKPLIKSHTLLFSLIGIFILLSPLWAVVPYVWVASLVSISFIWVIVRYIWDRKKGHRLLSGNAEIRDILKLTGRDKLKDALDVIKKLTKKKPKKKATK